MAAFDATLEMQQIEEMDEEDVKEELAAAGEKVSGTRRRLNERLHARRCKDAAEATAADEGDEESPLSDEDIKQLCISKRVARASTDTRHDLIVKLQARGYLDARGRYDPRNPRLRKIETLWDEPDSFWVTNVQNKGGKKYASTTGTGLIKGHGGTGDCIPYHQAVFRSKVMALTHVPTDWEDVWESEEAAPFAARAYFLLEEPAKPENHGANQFDEPGVRFVRRANGDIVKEVRRNIEGRRVYDTVVVHTAYVDELYQKEAEGLAPPGSADVAAFLAADALRDPAAAQKKKLELCALDEAAAEQETEALHTEHLDHLNRLLDARDVDLAQKSNYTNVTSKKKIEVAHPEKLHLINPDCPGHEVAIKKWRGCRSLSGRGKDVRLNDIRDAYRPPKWEPGGERTIMHDIIVAAMPQLEHQKFRHVLDYLVSKAQIDHIFSGVTDHPSNLYIIFAGHNAHFNDFRNCPAKAARFGDKVMSAAAAWVRKAVTNALKAVSVESA